MFLELISSLRKFARLPFCHSRATSLLRFPVLRLYTVNPLLVQCLVATDMSVGECPSFDEKHFHSQ